MNRLKILISAGAMLGLAAGSAHAARLIDMEGNPHTPTGAGMTTDAAGFQEGGGPYSGCNGLECESAVPFSKPGPGTVNMRINSFVNEFPMYASWTGMNSAGTGTNNKQQGYGIYGWVRIDLGIDGMTRNGIRYGAFTEIRENNTTAVSGGTTSVSSGFAQNASGDSTDNTLYVRHANVYIGTDELGFIRIGTGLGAQTLLETGLFDDFDIGGWVNLASSNIPGNIAPLWPWADEGAAYMPARVMYVSPVIAGFDGVIAFAPNSSVPFDGSGCSSDYTGCATQSSSTSAGDIGRFRNELGMGLRYRGSVGPVGFAVAGIYTVSGKVEAAGAANIPANQYNGENIGDVGAEVTYAHRIAIGGNVMFGAFNGNWGLQPKPSCFAAGICDSQTTTAVAWTAGVKYYVPQLPLTLGTYYFNYKDQGAIGLPTQRVYQGIDVGAVYGLGPGVVLVAEYAWGQNYQGDYNFLTGAAGNQAGANLHNQVQAQVATAGISLRF